ncbi:DUF4388 domain-containing protein [Deinobacterium chartae]|nr:DUF4388 domain-containing protein [Deinobacterium chartae]
MPLSSVLELIHLSRKSGVMRIKADLPLSLTIRSGEVVAGHVLDWQGFEAIQTLDPSPESGEFRFDPESEDEVQFQMGFTHFLTEWARLYDEWTAVCEVIGSPSQAFASLVSAPSPYALFGDGKSVRALARSQNLPTLTVAQTAREGLRSGKLRRVERYAWLGLRIRHPLAPTQAVPPTNPNQTQPLSPPGLGLVRRGRFIAPPATPRDPLEEIPRFLDGGRNLNDLLILGFTVPQLRSYLIGAIQSGELRFDGAGWVLRDLLWEQAYAGG